MTKHRVKGFDPGLQLCSLGTLGKEQILMDKPETLNIYHMGHWRIIQGWAPLCLISVAQGPAQLVQGMVAEGVTTFF